MQNILLGIVLQMLPNGKNFFTSAILIIQLFLIKIIHQHTESFIDMCVQLYTCAIHFRMEGERSAHNVRSQINYYHNQFNLKLEHSQRYYSTRDVKWSHFQRSAKRKLVKFSNNSESLNSATEAFTKDIINLCETLCQRNVKSL